jgi:Cu2+-containing amine oxidase
VEIFVIFFGKRSVGYNGEPEFENKRLVQLFMYNRNFSGDNHYSHPLDFVVG